MTLGHVPFHMHSQTIWEIGLRRWLGGHLDLSTLRDSFGLNMGPTWVQNYILLWYAIEISCLAEILHRVSIWQAGAFIRHNNDDRWKIELYIRLCNVCDIWRGNAFYLCLCVLKGRPFRSTNLVCVFAPDGLGWVILFLAWIISFVNVAHRRSRCACCLHLLVCRWHVDCVCVITARAQLVSIWTCSVSQSVWYNCATFCA